MDTKARIAILSDVHGNLEALSSVLAEVDALNVPQVLCLGDMVGYGPEPDACVKLLRERGVQCLLGNHEHGLLEAQARGWFNPQARKALDRTRALLSDDSLMYFRTLPRTFEVAGALFVHGCPPGLVSKYLYELDDDDFRKTFSLYPNPLCFVGHTHELERISLLTGPGADPECEPGAGVLCGKLERKVLGKGLVTLERQARHILNIGAVGQPRDGNNKAKYVLWEPQADSAPDPSGDAQGGKPLRQLGDKIDVRFVGYDIAKTAAAIIEKGLPSIYADRLW